jgi:beta-alanine degradation protein BauB
VVETQYAPVGSRVVFENDRVRVWEIELGPGEELPMHLHELDYVFVVVSGGPTTITWEDGRQETNEHQPGEVLWRQAPHAHALRNDGQTRYLNRLVELKAPA